MVGNRDNQYNVLLEAVQNHTPEVVVIDEIGNKSEVAAVRTIAERGVVMVSEDGTSWGNISLTVIYASRSGHWLGI